MVIRRSVLRAGISLSLALWLSVASGQQARAVEVRVSDDVWFDLHYMLQSWVQLTNNGPSQTNDLQTDFLVKRSRFTIKGQVAPGVGFFLGTGGDANFGSFDVWDALAWVDFHRGFTVDAGLVLLPFVHHAQQFSSNLHTLDFLKTAFRYPTGSTVMRRDAGVRFRGLLFGDRLDYRLGITDGATTADDIPRFTGRVGFNVFDPEPDFVLNGTYLGKKKVLTFGLAFDLQPDVVVGEKLYYALGADAFWDIPLGSDRLSGQLAVLYYRGLNAKDASGAAIVADKTGVGTVFDIGYAFGGKLEPVVAVEWFRPEGADDFDQQQMGLHLGFNWWVYGKAVNLKLDLALQKEPGQDFGDAARIATVQLQTWLP